MERCGCFCLLRWRRSLRIRSFRQISKCLKSSRLKDFDFASPKQAPEGQIGIEDVSAGLIPSWLPEGLKALLRRPWILWVLLLLLVLIVFQVAGFGLLLGGVLAALAAVAAGLVKLIRDVRMADTISEDGITPETTAGAPPRPGFVIAEPGATPPPTGPAAGGDSLEARNFRTATIALAERLALKPPPETPKVSLNLDILAGKLTAALDPKLAIPKRLLAT